MPDFYDHPALYDALLPIGGHVPFYQHLAQQHPNGVLELACGTGQLTVPLAESGASVVALDRSLAMLSVARHRVVSGQIAFVQGDMRGFAFRRQFDLIIIARNSLLHLLSHDDLLAALTAVRSHLAPNGIFAFDVFNPDSRRLARPRGERFPVMEVRTTTFGRLVVEEASDYDPATQVNHATWFVSTEERPDAWTLPLVLRSIFPDELVELLSAAGLTLVDRFGELSGEPFGRNSRVQVCVCRSGR